MSNLQKLQNQPPLREAHPSDAPLPSPTLRMEISLIQMETPITTRTRIFAKLFNNS